MDRDAVRGGEGDGKRLHERLRGILGVGGILVKVKMMSPNQDAYIKYLRTEF